MRPKTFALSLLSLALLAAFGPSPASATHSLCHNESSPDDVELVRVLGHDVSVDTGLNFNGAYVVCVDNVGLMVYVLGAPTGTGAVTELRLCDGNVPGYQCASILGATGASVGPGGPGLTCTVGTCVYLWANGVQVVP